MEEHGSSTSSRPESALTCTPHILSQQLLHPLLMRHLRLQSSLCQVCICSCIRLFITCTCRQEPIPFLLTKLLCSSFTWQSDIDELGHRPSATSACLARLSGAIAYMTLTGQDVLQPRKLYQAEENTSGRDQAQKLFLGGTRACDLAQELPCGTAACHGDWPHG